MKMLGGGLMFSTMCQNCKEQPQEQTVEINFSGVKEKRHVCNVCAEEIKILNEMEKKKALDEKRDKIEKWEKSFKSPLHKYNQQRMGTFRRP